MNAPNTPPGEIKNDAPYHMAGKGTVAGKDYKPENCRTCKPKKAAEPAHVCDGPRNSLRVFCAEHCPYCVKFRKENAGGVEQA